MTQPPDPFPVPPVIGPPATATEAEQIHQALATLSVQVDTFNTRLEQDKTAFNASLGSVRSRLAALAVIVILVVGALVGVVVLGVKYRNLAQCTADLIKGITVSGEVSRSSRDQQDQAQVTMIDVILNPSSTTGQRRAALTQYQQERQAALRQRDANPLPVGSCGQ